MTHFAFESSDRLPEEAAPDRPLGEEAQHVREIEKLISALSVSKRRDLYILLLIAQREGWSLWGTNKEMGYFPLDMPLIEAIDSSEGRWIEFVAKGGKA